jgi:hypothetical protein
VQALSAIAQRAIAQAVALGAAGRYEGWEEEIGQLKALAASMKKNREAAGEVYKANKEKKTNA